MTMTIASTNVMSCQEQSGEICEIGITSIHSIGKPTLDSDGALGRIDSSVVRGLSMSMSLSMVVSLCT